MNLNVLLAPETPPPLHKSTHTINPPSAHHHDVGEPIAAEKMLCCLKTCTRPPALGPLSLLRLHGRDVRRDLRSRMKRT